MYDTNIKPKKPEGAIQASGLAPFIVQGTAVTDNLSFMMKNTVVVFGSDTHVIIESPKKPQQGGTSDEQHGGGSEVTPSVSDEEASRLP